MQLITYRVSLTDGAKSRSNDIYRLNSVFLFESNESQQLL